MQCYWTGGLERIGRIGDRNPRLRSHQQMAADVAVALASQLTRGGKHSVLHDALWQWTEFHGKYRSCPLWTPAALAERESNPLPGAKKYRHEHALPKAVLMGTLFEMTEPKVERARGLLDAFVHGVVVARAEGDRLSKAFRRSMPPAFDDPAANGFRDSWLRYRMCSVRVVEVATGRVVVEVG